MDADQIKAALSALTAALGNGNLSVRFADGRQVTYRSAADLLAAIKQLRADLAVLTPLGARPRLQLRGSIIGVARD